MRKSWLSIGVAAMTRVALEFWSPAQAEKTGSPEKSIEQRFEELDQEIRILKRTRELEQEAAATAKQSTAVVKAGNTGFSLESADGQHVIKLRGLLQVDHRLYFEGVNDVRNRTDQRAGDLDANGFHDAADSWLTRRVRPIIEGTLFGKYDFRFTPEFAGGNASVVEPTLMPASIRLLNFARVSLGVLSDWSDCKAAPTSNSWKEVMSRMRFFPIVI